MSFLSRLPFASGSKVPVYLQTEAAECGLACLAMVATYHGNRIELATLRRRNSISLKGVTLAHLVEIAGTLGLATNAVRVELGAIKHLRLPCVLHWDFNHFVVLTEVRGDSVTIHDPVSGRRGFSFGDLSTRFTGVALELWPNENFQERSEVDDRPPTGELRAVTGRVIGLYRSLALVLTVALALEAIVLASPLFLQWVVDEAIVTANRDLLVDLALGFGMLLLFQVLISAARSWMLMFLSTAMNVQWRANVLAHLLRLPMDYFQKRHLGDVSSRFGSVDKIQDALTTSSVVAVLDGIMSVALLVMMYLYSPLLATVVIAVMSTYAGSRVLAYGPLKRAAATELVHSSRQTSHFMETVRGIKTIKLFQREDVRRAAWLRHFVAQMNARLKAQKGVIGYRFVNDLLIGAENILVIWLGARMVLAGDFSVGMLMAFKAYKDAFDGRVSNLIDRLFQVGVLKTQGERLADIVLTEPEAAADASGTRGGELSADIVVSGLNFKYAEHEPSVLKGIDLTIRSGESVAITGASGSGKTTLMQILLGALEPTTGTVTVGGRDLRQLGVHAVRSMSGTVSQDDVLLAGTVAENISFFDLRADRARIEQCARMAAIHEEISAFPLGYDSRIGERGGIGLSGGQIQRILVARALHRRPKILLLDEATSHLDLEREREVNEAIKALRITRVVIAHRPATIASADRVVMLIDGKIVSDIRMHHANAPSTCVALCAG
jgi:ATP-binding cassette subfamily B protein RaxB